MKTFKEYMNSYLTEAKGYAVEVEVRDARAANDLAQDRYRGLYKNDGSNVFVFKKESDKEDFETDLLDMGLEVLEESLNEAKMYVSDYLSDDDVRRIAIFTGGSWKTFKKRVDDGIKQYLELTLDGAKNIRVDRADINGYLVATAQTRLWVKRIQYTYELNGDRQTGEIKNQEIWVTL